MENLIERAARDLLNSRYAIALTGAGMSTESGIPDFRGPSGIWTKNPEAERKAYRSYETFLHDPRKWWEERLTGPNLLGDLAGAAPNAGHRALVELEKAGILKCVITQNIDGLHEKAGTSKLLEYHGSVLKLRCIHCTLRFRPHEFDLKKLMSEGKLPPRCPYCQGIVKTDTVAFGESIPQDVADMSLEEVWKCDLMLICGTSAVVYPFANLPRIARQSRYEDHWKAEAGLGAVASSPSVKIIEINGEPTPLTAEGISDYIITGKTGEILPQIVEAVKKLKK
ncbi:MAG: NAD-dependent deacylase [Dehalococcoidia bacterium]|nr:NAD-dependent deacylase [Dehalococcoidia bacterium]MDD5494739.1 NAD-dependent deacylase [Dehalococcoidia bacterium]